MTKKKETLKSKYVKERKRIQQGIRRLQKKGFILDKDILPDIPKRITKASVRRLAKITMNEIYKKSKFVNPETGEIFDGLAGKQQYKEYQRSKKNNEQDYPTYSIITTILDKIDSLPQTRLVYSSIRRKLYYMDIEGKGNVLRSIIEEGINEIGTYKLAELYTQQQGSIFSLLDELKYDSEEEDVHRAFSNLAFILNRGGFLTYKQATAVEDLGAYYESSSI